MSRTKGNNGSKGGAELGPTTPTTIITIHRAPHKKIKLLAWPSLTSFIHPITPGFGKPPFLKDGAIGPHWFMLSNWDSRDLGPTLTAV